jgi:hypothetical protein
VRTPVGVEKVCDGNDLFGESKAAAEFFFSLS